MRLAHLFDFFGAPEIRRAYSDLADGIVVAVDNKHYTPQTLTPAQFEGAVIGEVFAICNVVNPGALELLART